MRWTALRRTSSGVTFGPSGISGTWTSSSSLSNSGLFLLISLSLSSFSWNSVLIANCSASTWARGTTVSGFRCAAKRSTVGMNQARSNAETTVAADQGHRGGR